MLRKRKTQRHSYQRARDVAAANGTAEDVPPEAQPLSGTDNNIQPYTDEPVAPAPEYVQYGEAQLPAEPTSDTLVGEFGEYPSGTQGHWSGTYHTAQPHAEGGMPQWFFDAQRNHTE